MIEQKLDRIIELLEVIAGQNPVKRKTRAQLYDESRPSAEKLSALKGKLTFEEICEAIGIEANQSNRVRVGALITKLGIKQTRTKTQRYYHFD